VATTTASASETGTSPKEIAGPRFATQSSSITPAITYDYTTKEYVMVYIANNSSDDIIATTSTNGTTWTTDSNTGLVSPLHTGDHPWAGQPIHHGFRGA
jgi:hypothetical protein